MNSDIKKRLYNGRYIIILLIVVTALTIATPKFLSMNNFLNILWSVSVVGIISMGATFVILVGKIDLSVGQMAAMAGIVCAMSIKAGCPITVAVLMAALVDAFIGVCNGILVSQFKVPEFIATLATGSMITGVAQIISQGKTISIIEVRNFTLLGSGKLFSIPIPIFCFAIAFLVAWFILKRTVFGRQCYSVGGNARAARVSNISVKKIIIVAYMLSGIASAFGGIVLTALNQQVSSSTASGYELDVIASIVIGGVSMAGGVGTIGGSVFGVLLLGLISNGLNLLSVPGSWHPVVKGIIIVAAVAFNGYSVRFIRMGKTTKSIVKKA